MFKVCIISAWLACVALSGVTADPIPTNGTLVQRLGYARNDTNGADAKTLQHVGSEDDGLMREIKNESNERLEPHENGKEGTEKPLFNDAEQYTNTRSYIATKIRPKNIPVERFTN